MASELIYLIHLKRHPKSVRTYGYGFTKEQETLWIHKKPDCSDRSFFYDLREVAGFDLDESSRITCHDTSEAPDANKLAEQLVNEASRLFNQSE